MTLIKSISGIRGTIGGQVSENLTPLDIVKFVTAYATLLEKKGGIKHKVVVGRDGRISGEMVRSVVAGTLMGMGFDVIDIGYASTPTTEMAVILSEADGGIILTASHNPRQWNALKLLNERGEFLNAAEGAEVLSIAEAEDFLYKDVDTIGHLIVDNTYDDKHIDKVLDLPLVNVEGIRKAGFNVAIDAINSVGAIILPKLLDRLGVKYTVLNGEVDGDFRHNPEPLEKNLTGIMELVAGGGYDAGFVVDPDVDRLAFITEKGQMFGEEYTLVSVADYVLSHTPGDTVSNMSSTRALSDVTKAHGGTYRASAVGEVNVTTLMRESGAIIGGEGNGGVIYPQIHSGRDALVGIALFLSLLVEKGTTVSELRKTYPDYYMGKNRMDLQPGTDVDALLAKVKEHYSNERINDADGVKIDFEEGWVHLRKSNTEPIIRIYSEARTQERADEMGQEMIELAKALL